MSVVVRYWSWADAAEQVTHLDATSGTVTISKPTKYGLRLGMTGIKIAFKYVKHVLFVHLIKLKSGLTAALKVFYFKTDH